MSSDEEDYKASDSDSDSEYLDELSESESEGEKPKLSLQYPDKINSLETIKLYSPHTPDEPPPKKQKIEKTPTLECLEKIFQCLSIKEKKS